MRELWHNAAPMHRCMGLFVTISCDEVPAVLCSFFTLFNLLGSYFVLIPLREEAGISLGTSNLPLLFTCSLLVTLLFTPAASAFLSRRHPKGRDVALKQLYLFMAFTLLVFYFLYNFSATSQLLGRVATHTEQLQQWQQHLLLNKATPAREHQHEPASAKQFWGDHRQLLASPTIADMLLQAPVVSPHITAQFNIPTQQLQPVLQHEHEAMSHQSTNTEQQDMEKEVVLTGRRLQHMQAMTSSSGSTQDQQAKLMTAVGISSTGLHNRQKNRQQSVSSKYGDPTLTGHQKLLRAAFYVWVNVLNLAGISSLWARCADAFTPEAGARLFGFISAGATLGQLAGSLLALAVSRAAEAAVAVKQQPQQHSEVAGASIVGSGSATTEPPASGLILVAAAMQFIAAQLVCKIKPYSHGTIPTAAAGKVSSAGTSMHGPSAGASEPEQQDADASQYLGSTSGDATFHVASTAAVRRPHSSHAGNPRGNSWDTAQPAERRTSDSHHHQQQQGSPRLSNLLLGFKLILSSRYLLMVCGNLLLTYVVGSLMYFQRALVVSVSVQGPTYRAAFFATLNSWSAAGILILQLCATSSMLRFLGMPAALSLGPCICLLGILMVTLMPSPSVVAGFEIIRKLIGYAVHRPAREVLFTVVPRDKKYRAKLVIDTVVQRLGDALAAGAFQVLDVWWSLGQAGVGATGCVMCMVWLAAAEKLGRQHEQLRGPQAWDIVWAKS